MLLFQSIVSGGAKYSFVNQKNIVTFEVHNDSPYSVGIKFGSDAGYVNADYFLLPHQHLYGISPYGVSSLSVGGASYTGTVFLYTRAPQGGGVINITAVPACEITVVGYPAGAAPAGATSLSRMSTVPNTVNNVSGVADSIQNDNNSFGTSIAEAKEINSTGSNVSIDNSGNVYIAEWNSGTLSYTKLFQILANQDPCVVVAANNRTIQNLGNLETAGVIYSPAAFGMTISVNGGADTRINLQVGGNNVHNVLAGGEHDFEVNNSNIMSIKNDGPHLLTGAINLLSGKLSRIVLQTQKSFASGTTLYTHGLGFQPGWLIIISTDGAAVAWGWTNPSNTQINIIQTSGATHICDLLFLSF